MLLLLLRSEEAAPSVTVEQSRGQGGFDPYYYKRRKKPEPVSRDFGADWTPPAPRPLPTPALAPYVPRGWASNIALVPVPPPAPARVDVRAIAARQLAERRAAEEAANDDDEEILLLLAA